MKNIFFILFCNTIISNYLQAQMEISNWRHQTESWNAEQGTRGILLQFDYLYSGANMLPVTNQIQLMHNGQVVYNDTTALLLLFPNQKQSAQFFIPYRQINLPEGNYDMITVQYRCAQLAAWSEVLAFQQPARLAVDFEVFMASVKQKMENWDKGRNPYHWLPDPYFTLTTNGGTIPVFTARDTLNSYQMPPRSARVFILENEQIWWNWYDEDGEVDDTLGKILLPLGSGDFTKTAEGLMFSEMKGISFRYTQKLLRTQPITLRVQPDFVYQGRKGLRLEAEYHLARAYKNEQISPFLWLENEYGDTSMIKIAYPLEGSPAPGKPLRLSQTDGKVVYFIPFYAWNNKTKFIHFSFKTQNGQNTVSAPYAVLNPILFESFLVYANYEVQENYNYLGASGIRLRLHYQVRDVHKYAPLQVGFSAVGNCDVYHIKTKTTYSLLKNKQLEIAKPKDKDTLDFFIPYFNLVANQLNINMELVPDTRLLMLKQKTDIWKIPSQVKDIVLELKSAENLCWDSNYGHTVHLYYRVPRFLQEHAKLDVKASIKGYVIENYTISTTALDSAKCPLRDTGSVRLVFPFRKLQNNDSLELLIQMVEKEANKPLSLLVKHNWKAPLELHNLSIAFDLRHVIWDKSTSSTVDSVDFPFEYMVKVGTETKIRQVLHPDWTKERREQINRPINLHREDKIEISVRDTRKGGEQYILWLGDAGRLQQFNNTAVWADPEGLLKKAVIKAVVNK